ncbi:hypothetical protein b3_0206 [Synechococcus phage B3]|nr:hypothetical protein b3_0206 [Synechococcus phage B3]QGT54819.1 hypothetical protein b23_0204 [Synechococcus phage B23]
MITTTHLTEYYNNILKRVQGSEKAPYPFTKDLPLSQFEWKNLVEVCSIIKANSNRFNMATWHDKKESCGTVHCIAGWAASLMVADTNTNTFSYNVEEIPEQHYESIMNTNMSYAPGIFAVSTIASYMLSNYLYPFFFLTTAHLGLPLDYDIETVIMEELIEPILEIASQECLTLSQEVTQFIEKAKQETCLA